MALFKGTLLKATILKEQTLKLPRTTENKVYDYLLENAVGYGNRISSPKLMKRFGIKDNKTFRGVIERIRQNDEFDKIICSQAGHKGGYWIATNQQEVEDTLNHLYKRSMEMLKTYSIIRNKAIKDNQYKFDDKEIKLVETILRG
jgi:hypothetical protein